MDLHLPKPIELYFVAGNANDTDGLADCFVDQATVLDEGRILQGRNAIKEWNAASKAKYRHTIEPLEMIDDDGKIVVRGRVTGRFPASPVVLQFSFRLTNDKISHLEIG